MIKINLPLSDGRSRWDNIVLALATGFYLSLLPPKLTDWLKQKPAFQKYSKYAVTGSGLAGSFWGLVTYLILPRFLAVNIFVLIAVTLFSVWIGQLAEKLLARHDDSRIVIDEWIGCWIGMAGLRHHLGFEVMAAFVLFRFFDVWKGPWGKKLQNLPGGWGVVMDDVAAGVAANFCARILIVTVGVL